MKTIKFRGKRLDNGEWVYGDSINTQRNAAIVEEFEDDGFRVSIKTGYYVSLNSVGQFVNRTDKRGKEVYVGDTVEGYYIDQIYGCSVSKVLIKIEQYEDVVKLDELDSFAVLAEVE